MTTRKIPINRVATLREYLVNANPDGSIPLNAIVLANLQESHDQVRALIVDALNEYFKTHGELHLEVKP